jgi:predicted benzoate:H+ symporter BenE
MAARTRYPCRAMISADRHGTTLLLAPFGGYALNLSGDHRRHLHGPARRMRTRRKRYTAAMVNGVLYVRPSVWLAPR